MGPEGSLVALVLCLAVSTDLLVRAARRHAIARPFWLRVAKPPAIT
jgi:hypothetical protein